MEVFRGNEVWRTALRLLGLLLLLVCAHGWSAAEQPAGERRITYVSGVDPRRTVEEICCGREAGFRPLDGGVLATGYGEDASWLRIDVDDGSRLLVLDTLVDEADLYIVDGSGEVVRHMQAGDTRPASVRPIVTPRTAFPLEGAGTENEILLRIGQATSVAVGVRLTTPDQFWDTVSREAIIRAILYGAVCIMIAFNIAVSIPTRDPTFFFNALTIAGILLLDVYLTGVGSAHVWPEQPQLSNRLLNLGLIAPPLFGSIFFYLFLGDRPGSVTRRLRMLLVSPALAIVLFACVPFVSYWRIQIAALVLIAVMIAIILTVCVLEAWQGNRRAIALLFPLVGGIVPGAGITFSQKMFGFDYGVLDGHLLEITLVCEALLFSLALAYRIRLAQEEREEIQSRFLRHMADSERRLIAAIDDERSRIAADLHDTAGQGMLAIVNRLARLGRATGTPHDLRSEIDAIARSSKETVGEVRRISHNLHSATLQQLGLLRALRALTEQAAASAGLKVSLETNISEETLTEEQHLHVYRIVQELLSNAARHSGGRMCAVRLASSGGDIVLEVSDDGQGLRAGRDGGKPEDSGIGLETVAQRVRCLHGGWTVRDLLPGTEVTVRFPLRPPAGEVA